MEDCRTMKIRIAEIAEKRGFMNAFALQKGLNCSPTMASRLWKGNFKQIGISTLNKLCDLLDCETSDLISFQSGKPKTPGVIPGAERAEKIIKPIIEPLDGGDYTLTFAEAVEQLGKKDSSVRRYLKKGRLRGEKIDREWQIWASDLLEFQNSDWFRNLK